MGASKPCTAVKNHRQSITKPSGTNLANSFACNVFSTRDHGGPLVSHALIDESCEEMKPSKRGHMETPEASRARDP